MLYPLAIYWSSVSLTVLSKYVCAQLPAFTNHQRSGIAVAEYRHEILGDHARTQKEVEWV
jgi:hypothetical protein